MIWLVTLSLTGCDDTAKKNLQDVVQDKIALGIMPDIFVERFNESLPVVLEALLENDAFARESLTKLYMIYGHTVHKGSRQGVFKSVSGPYKTPVFGTTANHGELIVIGSSLGDNSNEARQDFLLIITTVAHALTGESPKKIHTMMMRLLLTLVDNSDQVVAEGMADVLFTATLSRTGIAIQAEHKQ